MQVLYIVVERRDDIATMGVIKVSRRVWKACRV